MNDSITSVKEVGLSDDRASANVLGDLQALEGKGPLIPGTRQDEY